MIKHYKIKDIGDFFGGLTGKTKEDFGIGDAKYVTYMTVFSNPQLPDNISDYVSISDNEKQNKIQKGDILFTGSSETPDECGMSCVVTKEIEDDIYLNSFCFGLRPSNNEIAIPEYLSHYFRSNNVRKQISKTANGVTRFNISKKILADVEILIPSIKEQEKIAEILDSFTNLIDALNEELSLRQKQFEYYREKLLTFDGCVKITVEDFCLLKAGKAINANELSERCDEMHPYACYGGNGIRGYIGKSSHNGTYPIIGRQGALCGCVSLGAGVFYATEHAVVVTAKKGYDSKYLYYLFKNANLNQYKSNGAQPGLAVSNLNLLEFSIPSLSIQQSIVEKLDAFESLISSLKEEISLRQKQYEYYREKLLTFN